MINTEQNRIMTALARRAVHDKTVGVIGVKCQQSRTRVRTQFTGLPNKRMKMFTACSLELSATYFQPTSSIFLSQQISQQCFQPLIYSSINCN
jgi:hypothetical protein